MKSIYTYNVSDIETDIVTLNIFGVEVCKLTGIPKTKISAYCTGGYLYHDRYLITKNDRVGKADERSYTAEDLKVMAEWDKTRLMINPKAERVS